LLAAIKPLTLGASVQSGGNWLVRAEAIVELEVILTLLLRDLEERKEELFDSRVLPGGLTGAGASSSSSSSS
jgi:hypothetical protein